MDWDSDYSVGIHEIDEQHRTLVEHVTAIERSVSEGERWGTVHVALARLTIFTEIHFAVEESLMRIHDYPRLEEHANEHRAFTDRVRALQERSLRDRVSPNMAGFLRTWVEKHIPNHDKSYAFHFLRRTALGGRQA